MKPIARSALFACTVCLCVGATETSQAQDSGTQVAQAFLIETKATLNSLLGPPRTVVSDVDAVEVQGSGTVTVGAPHSVQSIDGITFVDVTEGSDTVSLCPSGECLDASSTAQEIDLAGGLVRLSSVEGHGTLNNLSASAQLSFPALSSPQRSLVSHYPPQASDTPPGTSFHFEGYVPHTELNALGIVIKDSKWVQGDITVNDLGLKPDPDHPGGRVASAYTVCSSLAGPLGQDEVVCSQVAVLRVKP